MAHTSSFHGGCEIVEVEEDNSNKMGHDKNAHHSRLGLRTEEKDSRSLPSNFSDVSSLEDDLNQLFETFNRRHSSQGTGYSPHNGTGTSKKHSSKKPMRASSASAHGISEKVNLKQAFRGLCISQASEMAAMKRSTKPCGSSEAGRIMTMYRNVVVDDNSSVVSQDEGKQGLLEISLMPEEPATSSKEFGSSSSQNDGALESHDLRNEVTSVEGLSRKKTPNGAVKMSQSALMRNAKKLPLTEPEAVPSSAETSQGETETEFLSASSKCASQASLTEMPQKDQHGPSPSASHSGDGRNSLEISQSTAVHIGTVPSSPAPGLQTSGDAILQKEEHVHEASSYHSDHYRNTQEPSSKPHKLMNKESAVKSAKIAQKGTSAGLGRGNKTKKSTRSVSHLVKPAIKTKSFAKRKSKKDKASAHSPNVPHSELNNALYPGPNNAVCPRCQCVLADEWEEVGEDLLFSPGATTMAQLSPYSLDISPSVDLSPFTHVASPSAERSMDNGFSDVRTPNNNLNSTKKPKETVGKEGKSKSREKGEFTQSSKSSPEECSTSTSISEETNLSRPSCCDRPHMSKDVRWQAIREFKAQHGAVSLRHFNLLKKLGCGDIGTVYLAELIDTNCLFAIKVMDNEFLARRKKIMRAQTEREILRMLDHPFLPTLYCQFTSDNLSCLVMEYCPGGDLHVLRQKQPGRCFTEHAARFYLAEVLLALEYLHMLGVIYRDLKPENILVREDGHIMLSDFDLSLRCAVNPTLLISSPTTEPTRSMSGPFKDSGCVQPFCIQQPSCQVSCFGPKIPRAPTKPKKPKPEPSDPSRPLPLLVAEPTSARSNSFVGTHEYLAPEIIKGEGHGAAVDWWTFGIFLYELLYGRTPFRGVGNEETLANVVLQSLKFPDCPLVSLQARDLINRLLVKEPEGRLGSERGAAEIKQHPFFEGLNWALIRCAVPPELPEFHRSYGAAKGSFHENNNGGSSGYLEYNASSGEHLEFEVF